MNIYINPEKEQRKVLLKRPQLQAEDLENTISTIFQEVTLRGDEALRKYTQQFDRVSLQDFKVTPEEFDQAIAQLPAGLKEAIETAAKNIAVFHAAHHVTEAPVETMPGVTCWRKSVPVDAVGLYIPGGTAPLFSTVLMLGIPARIAGCERRILCTPPASDGSVHPAILCAAQVAGITEVYKVGGAQAIAAMAVGTETIPVVDKIFGPGNQYVMAAKHYAQRLGVAMDLPAGPSEVLVAADDSVPPVFVAADLLAQAEHGTDSQVVFVTDSAPYVQYVRNCLEQQLEDLPRKAIASVALGSSVAMVLPSSEWADLINEYAPEHLILAGKYEQEVVQDVRHAGSVFLGQYTAESFGDYASGTNHTLPTAGYAKAWSGVSLDSFVRKITFQRVSEEGLRNLGPVVIRMAEAEELKAHANAVTVRLDAKKSGL